MDTTQKSREEARKTAQQGQRKPSQQRPQSAKQRPQNAQRKQRPAAEAQASNPSGSAQQRNGAARTAGQQRGGTSRPKQQRPKQAAPRQKRPVRQDDPNDISNKKRAYGNSKPKKKTALNAVSDVFQRAGSSRSPEKTARAKARREKRNAKLRRYKKQLEAPAIIYTQPKTFNRSRFAVQMLTVTAVVLALVLGISVFFKVETITVSGADVYSAWAVREASGIAEGDNLLSFSTVRASSQIMANLPYVESVRIGIKLPDTVNIMIEEEDVVYAIKSSVGDWWLMNSDGRVVEQSNGAVAAGYTQVLGVTLDNPIANSQGVATEDVPTETDESGELIPITVTGAQRLNAALQILNALEANDIVGEAATVDVSRTEDIILWYGTRYQVNLGDSARLDYKVTCMNDAILQMSDYQSGILDISFTTWTDKVVYTPFE